MYEYACISLGGSMYLDIYLSEDTVYLCKCSLACDKCHSRIWFVLTPSRNFSQGRGIQRSRAPTYLWSYLTASVRRVTDRSHMPIIHHRMSQCANRCLVRSDTVCQHCWRDGWPPGVDTSTAVTALPLAPSAGAECWPGWSDRGRTAVSACLTCRPLAIGWH